MTLFRGYRVQVVLRVVMLTASAAGAVALVAWTEFFYLPVAIAVATVVQLLGLIRYTEQTTRSVVHFLASVHQSDFTQGTAVRSRGSVQAELADAFEQVMAQFKSIRAEREEHLHYLQTTMQHIAVAVIAFRADGRIELINTAAKRLLDVPQLTFLDELVSLSPPLLQALRTMAPGDRTVVQVPYGAHDLHLALQATQFRLRGELHTLVSLHDIGSELDEQELDAWQKLTRVLTHEIMNSAAPIASLASTAHALLADSKADAETLTDARDALAAIERRSQALMHFSDSYRSFTTIEKPMFQVVQVVELIEPLATLLRRQMADEGVQFTLDITPPTLDLTADAELIEQVLLNLLLNALDAVRGQPEPRITVRASIDPRGRPLVQVSDNGSGIPDDLRERIFVPFFTTKAEGSGIGLSLARQIMRLHGGRLTLRSQPGETVFSLRF
ncbi:MAG: sensor histidine kinase [Rhodothermales bacterium]